MPAQKVMGIQGKTSTESYENTGLYQHRKLCTSYIGAIDSLCLKLNEKQELNLL